MSRPLRACANDVRRPPRASVRRSRCFSPVDDRERRLAGGAQLGRQAPQLLELRRQAELACRRPSRCAAAVHARARTIEPLARRARRPRRARSVSGSQLGRGRARGGARTLGDARSSAARSRSTLAAHALDRAPAPRRRRGCLLLALDDVEDAFEARHLLDDALAAASPVSAVPSPTRSVDVLGAELDQVVLERALRPSGSARSCPSSP